ncbi:MAG: hypothetical protein AAGC95_08850 [Pseudomonadota bacterium]
MAKKKKSSKRKLRNDSVRHVKMRFAPQTDEEKKFKRADLVFEGVDHKQMSYEVRVFLNNKDVDDKTPRKKSKGYAGRFVVFGHGYCFGAEGHCNADIGGVRNIAPHTEYARRHPLTPQTRIITITDQLKEIIDSSKKGLRTISMVVIAKAPRRKDCKLAGGLFLYDGVTLQTYA